ncbi:Ger(x)C family spore germination protein [Candidatus Clostridium stratigraminis]|uniref:Ger(X)C family spore germination protein n=1 Tax=Candidatus Clostridium stratigraminis TaxID=3381661 RepID=A0ABW8T4N2_9CLOT
MKRIKVTKFLCLIIIPVIILTGCWDQKIYEDIGFILQLGLESSKDGMLLISYTTPVADPKKYEQVEFIYGNAGTLREFRSKARNISSKFLEAGKIQQIVISQELAEKGIINLLEVSERDSSNPTIAYIVISESSPKDLFDFSQKLGDKPLPSFYLKQLIDNNSRSGFCPQTSVSEFTCFSFAEGIDSIVPLVKAENKETKGIRVMGCALFNYDKMVGKLNQKDTSLLLAMKGKVKSSEYNFTSLGPPEKDISGKTGTAMFLYKPKQKIKVSIKDNIPIINISLKLDGIYEEHQWDHIDKKAVQVKYEKLMSQEIKSECLKLLQYTQEVGSDPIGIGDIIRAKYNTYWSNNNWKDFYSKAVFNIDVAVNIIRYGTIK